MAALEDLFYQIFSRKNWIIDQLKQQQDFYDQSLTSTLLINEIFPPSWLWKAGSKAEKGNPRELKKEELISGLLFPPQKTTATSSIGCYPLCERVFFKADNGHLSSSVFTETCASNRFLDAENKLTEASKSHLNESEVGLILSEKEVVVSDSLEASPQVQTDPQNVQSCFEPADCSLVRIQRSRSRQKAIELRNSEKLRTKKGPNKAGITDVCTGRITRSKVAFQESNCINDPPEPPKSLNHAEGRTKTTLSDEAVTTSEYDDRIKRNISTSLQPHFVDRLSEVVRSSHQREEKCPREASGIFATETISNAPEEAKSVHSGSKPNLIGPELRLTLEVKPRGSNCGSISQKPELPASGRKCYGKKESGPTEPGSYNVVEPKQLVFDDTENCDKLKPDQSSKNDDVSQGNQLQENEKRQNIETVDRKSLKDDQRTKVFSKEISEGSDRNAPVKEGFDLVEIEKVSYLSNHLAAEIWREALATPPGSKEMSNPKLVPIDTLGCLQEIGSKIDMGHEILEAAVSNFHEVDINPIAGEKSIDNLDLGSSLCESCGDPNIVLGDVQLVPVVGGACLTLTNTNLNNDTSFPCSERPNTLLESQQMSFSESALEKSIDNLDLKSTLCQSCRDTKIASGDFQLTSVESVAFLNCTSINLNNGASFPCPERLDTLLEPQGMEVLESAVGAAQRSLLKEIVTPKGPQVCSAGERAPYFLRSHSTGHYKNVDSFKSSGPHNRRKSIQVTEVSPKIAKICNNGRDTPYTLRSHSTGHDKNVDSLTSNGSHNMRKSRESMNITASFSVAHKNLSNNAYGDSWPQFKRRKIENQLYYALATSPRVRRVRPVLQIHDDDNISSYLRSAGVVSEHVKELQNFPTSFELGDDVVAGNLREEIDQSMEHSKKEGSEILRLLCSPLLAKEGNSNSKGKDQARMIQGLFKQTCLDSCVEFGLKKQVDGSIGSCLRDEDGLEESTSVVPDVGKWPASEIGLNSQCFESNEGQEKLFYLLDKRGDSAEGSFAEKSQHGEGSSYYTVKSPNDVNLDYNRTSYFLSSDETLPEFERFNVGLPTKSTDLSIMGNGFVFENSDVPSITEIGADALEQCGSSRIITPLPCSSTKYRIYTTPHVCQSLPNGLLEHAGLRSDPIFGPDSCKKPETCKSLVFPNVYRDLGAEMNGPLLGKHSLGCFSSSSSVRFGRDIKIPRSYTPPIGKISERIVSKPSSISSEKQFNRNPELTCFRIDEDASTSEENGHPDEMLDTPKKGTDSTEKKISTNHALTDVTFLYSNQPISISEAEKFLDRSSIDSVDAEKSLVRMQMWTDQKLEHDCGNNRRYTTEDKENRYLSLNSTRKANSSVRKRFLRPKLSSTAREQNGSHAFPGKGGNPKNIVSNISSFLPFVQKKQQAPAVLTGKRDIKVKSLEVAEAAKRLEEKKVQERKMKKEAAKLERAKAELENQRQLEMKQKVKEEERKKMEADLAAKKRKREEEERKEKERKRKCVEETRRQQREHEDKLRAEKEEKELRRKAMEEKDRKKKELVEESKRLQKTGKGREGAGCKKRTEAESRNGRRPTGDSKKASTIRENCGAFVKPDGIGKVITNVNSLGTTSEKVSPIVGGELQSYEITPYKGSDDEDEEDLTTRKFLVPWARKENLIPDLLLQQHVDPDEIFLRDKCFSLSEVIGTWNGGRFTHKGGH